MLSLAHNLPSESPACRDWPRTPPALKETSFLLRKLYHKWRVTASHHSTPPLLTNFTFLDESPLHSSSLLTKFFFQCDRFRQRFDQTSRNRMREKVTASLIFKDRKSSYPRRSLQSSIATSCVISANVDLPLAVGMFESKSMSFGVRSFVGNQVDDFVT